jgi:hypothetical protein
MHHTKNNYVSSNSTGFEQRTHNSTKNIEENCERKYDKNYKKKYVRNYESKTIETININKNNCSENNKCNFNNTDKNIDKNIDKNNVSLTNDLSKEQPSSSCWGTPHTQEKIPPNSQEILPIIILSPEQLSDKGLSLKFPNTWNIWIHPNSSKDWQLSSYIKLMTIYDVSNMWQFINNFKHLDYMNNQFFIMRNDITPRMEDPANIRGGSAVIRISVHSRDLLLIWSDVCVLTFNNEICRNPDSVNGISFNLKQNMTVIKIWNNNVNDDISKKISPLLFINRKLCPQYISHNINNIYKPK